MEDLHRKQKYYHDKICVDHFLIQIMREKDVVGRKLLNIEHLSLTLAQQQTFQEIDFRL